ncbi:XrtA/PEP-CTERM system TPR-repeat protein PrsT [Azospirillum canadense]|uniref:XrtA/PEP-CTERM system TPR-repeat protein PrsT n=1 Tax=Azospirillum canadense TaxID=403962 RepID=UPI0022272E05|nr:XrtA/PEP-CTERM system TPR-repeat protein PrsT [Azospirillum canadense]MCW2240937.1 putative PEP-CTERM system TPR-repeat lipoprotein [Azospirillum canadense]
MGAALIALAAAGDPGAAHAARDTAAEKFFIDAGSQLKEGNVNAAVIQLRNALQRDPDFAEARELLGELGVRQGDLATAEKELRRALELRRTERTEIALGRVLVREGKLEEALTVVGMDASTDALRGGKLTVRAQALVGLKRVDEAEPMLTEAIRLAPNADTYLETARVDLLRDRRDAAAKHLDMALASDSSLADAWLLKSDLLFRSGDVPGGLGVLEEGGKAAPKDARLPLVRAMMLIQTGRQDEADGDVQRVVALAPKSPLTALLQAARAFSRGNLEEAERLYGSAESQLRGNAHAELIGGLIKAQRGQTAQAEILLSRFISSNPWRQDIRRLVATLRLTIGNYQGAIDLLTAMLEVAPDDAALRRQLASAYLQAGDHGKAATEFRSLTQRPGQLATEARQALSVLEFASVSGTASSDGDKTVPNALDTLLVNDLLVSHHYKAALEKARALTTAAPDSAEAVTLLASVQMAQGDVSAAVESFKRAFQLSPGSPPATSNLVRAYVRLGKPGEAEAFLKERLAADPDVRAPNTEMMVRLYTQFLVDQGRRAEAITQLERAVAGPTGTATTTRDLSIILATQYLADNRKIDAIALLDGVRARYPRDAAALDMVVRGLAEAGAEERALDAARAWSALDGTDLRSRLLLARLAARLKRTDEARAAFADVLRVDAKNAPAARGLVELELKAGRAEEALAVARRMALAAPVTAAILEAEVLASTGKRKEAAAFLSQALARTPDPALQLARFNVRRADGDLVQGRAELTDWLKVRPADAPVRTALAEQAIAEGDFRTAVTHYEQLVRQAPDEAMLLNNLAWAKFKLKDPDAQSVARQALALAPTSVDITDTAGWIIANSGKLDEGLDLLRRAAMAAPKRPEIQYHLATALEMAGRKGEARTVLKAILASETPFAERDEARVLLAKIGD